MFQLLLRWGSALKRTKTSQSHQNRSNMSTSISDCFSLNHCWLFHFHECYRNLTELRFLFSGHTLQFYSWTNKQRDNQSHLKVNSWHFSNKTGLTLEVKWLIPNGFNGLDLENCTVGYNRGFARQSCCIAGTTDSFSYGCCAKPQYSHFKASEHCRSLGWG